MSLNPEKLAFRKQSRYLRNSKIILLRLLLVLSCVSIIAACSNYKVTKSKHPKGYRWHNVLYELPVIDDNPASSIERIAQISEAYGFEKHLYFDSSTDWGGNMQYQADSTYFLSIRIGKTEKLILSYNIGAVKGTKVNKKELVNLSDSLFRELKRKY